MNFKIRKEIRQGCDKGKALIALVLNLAEAMKAVNGEREGEALFKADLNAAREALGEAYGYHTSFKFTDKMKYAFADLKKEDELIIRVYPEHRKDTDKIIDSALETRIEGFGYAGAPQKKEAVCPLIEKLPCKAGTLSPEKGKKSDYFIKSDLSDEEAIRLIRVLMKREGCKGADRLAKLLREDGHHIGKNRIKRLLEKAIESALPVRRTAYSDSEIAKSMASIQEEAGWTLGTAALMDRYRKMGGKVSCARAQSIIRENNLYSKHI